jgi:hypothetical protein
MESAGRLFGSVIGLIVHATTWVYRDRRRFRRPRYSDQERPGIRFVSVLLLTFVCGAIGTFVGCW